MTYKNQTIQNTPAWRLDVDLTKGEYGNLLRFISYVPTARRPEEQVQFQTVLADSELDQLKQFFINQE